MQKQRELERRVRTSKRECMMLDKVGDKDGLTKASATLKQRQQALKKYCSDTGLSYKADRTAVVGYGKSLSSKVNMTNRKKYAEAVDKSIGSGIIKSIDIDDFKMMSEGRNIDAKAIDTISSVVEKYEKTGDVYINDFYFGSLYSATSGTPLLQIEPTADKTLRLNINTDIFSGRTIEEINDMLANTDVNIAQNLEEAVIHECGHAKSIKGKTIKEIEDMYRKIASAKVKGISAIAKADGAEALAEIEILIARGSEVPKEAMNFYKKYMEVNKI